MNNKAIILNDEVISDNPEGGTGKSLLVQGLNFVTTILAIDYYFLTLQCLNFFLI